MFNEFHRVFKPNVPDAPQRLGLEHALLRSKYKIEELVELIYAASNNDASAFEAGLGELKKAIDDAQQKIVVKNKKVEDPFVEEVDALADLMYLTGCSFSLMGVDPNPIMQIVHESNMSKTFDDGQPRYHHLTGKVLKPEHWEVRYAPESRIRAELDRQLGSK